MLPSVEALVREFMESEKLPASYLQTVSRWFDPLADDLLARARAHPGCFIVGINGSQGSGKSTLAGLLVLLLRAKAGLNCINLSLDDFYLNRESRQELGAAVHPLLCTRGVPGTHDVALALNTINRLQQPGEAAIPRFNKAQDERIPEHAWPRVQGPLDIIILEGWCLGLPAEDAAALDIPVNSLEAEQDSDASWRSYVNTRLAGEYQQLFGLLDYLLMLRAPGFEQVYHWRLKQEEKLAERVGNTDDSKLMSPALIAGFIQHYERLTRHALRSLPLLADTVFQLDVHQGISSRQDRETTRRR